jgi:hypothetical protein
MTFAIATLPSHKKVAWAWLDNLLGLADRVTRQEEMRGGPKTAPADLPPAVHMTPRAREGAIKDAYEDLKKQLINSIGKEIPTIRRKQREIARRHGLDETYFDWFLMGGRHWPPMPPKPARGLRAIQAIFTWYADMPDHWNNMVIPELDQVRDRDRAMKELGDWFVKTVVPKIERDYVRSVSKKSRDLVKTFKGRSAPHDPKAALLLMRDFEKRLMADRYPKRQAVQAVVNLFE